MDKKFTVVRILIFLGYIGFPVATLVLFCFSSRGVAQYLFLSFILLHAIERVWETFATTKERKANQLHGDWTLVAVTVAYILLCLLVVSEFFLVRESFNLKITLFGLVLYIVAVRIRWWGIKSLGKQWAIHAVGVRKIRRVRLIKIGAYKYVRHPIYLGSMLEMISLPLIANTFFSGTFSLVVNIPLQIVRMLLEEKNALRRFGISYSEYQKNVSMFIPFKYFKNRIFPHVGC